MTRREFDERIDEIRSLVLRMGACVVDMLELGVRCTLEGDESLYQRVKSLDDVIDESEKLAVGIAVDCLLKQAPVANDLRLLTSTLSIVGELEKAGDDAEKMASRARRLSGQFPDELKSALYDLQAEAAKVIRSATALYLKYDEEVASEALLMDDTVDASYKTARRRFMELIVERPESVRDLLRGINTFHAIEHAADRGVEIVKRLRLHHNNFEDRMKPEEPVESGPTEATP